MRNWTIRAVDAHPILTRAEELAIATRFVEKGLVADRNALVRANLRYVGFARQLLPAGELSGRSSNCRAGGKLSEQISASTLTRRRVSMRFWPTRQIWNRYLR